MNASELREMSDEQLEITIKDASQSLFHLKMQAQTERLDAPTKLRENRRLIARCKTIQTERAMAASKETADSGDAATS